MVPDCEEVGDGEAFMDILRARRSSSKDNIAESNSVCASYTKVS
jgi:hypothetical protein